MSDVNVVIVNGEAEIEIMEATIADQIYDKLESLQDQTVEVSYDPVSKELVLEFSDASRIEIDVEDHAGELAPVQATGGKFYVTTAAATANRPGDPNAMCPC